VSPTCFYPRPKVESAVVRFIFRGEPRVEVEDEDMFRRVVKASFGHRRKTLKNALRDARLLDVKAGEIEAHLWKAGIDPGRRGETLTMGEFAALTEVISKGMASRDGSAEEDLLG
jgi:16S rRNA (adenine1518-N6/adenine1519-N6)-dimethyltransferase